MLTRALVTIILSLLFFPPKVCHASKLKVQVKSIAREDYKKPPQACKVAVYQIDINANQTILDIKKKIQQYTKAPLVNHHIIFNGKKLHDNEKIANCNIVNGSELSSVLKDQEKIDAQQNDNKLQHSNGQQVQESDQAQESDEDEKNNEKKYPIRSSLPFSPIVLLFLAIVAIVGIMIIWPKDNKGKDPSKNLKKFNSPKRRHSRLKKQRTTKFFGK